MADKLEATIEELLRSMGATGKQPDGKLGASDEGEIKFAVARFQDQVLIVFGTPVAWLALPRDVAVQMARLMMGRAQEIEP